MELGEHEKDDDGHRTEVREHENGLIEHEKDVREIDFGAAQHEKEVREHEEMYEKLIFDSKSHVFRFWEGYH